MTRKISQIMAALPALVAGSAPPRGLDPAEVIQLLAARVQAAEKMAFAIEAAFQMEDGPSVLDAVRDYRATGGRA